jgi:CheY-like chemotaxis protein
VCQVLIVEDSTDVRESLAGIVEGAGHTSHQAANGREALRWLNEQQERPCIVLLDLRMPVMDGWDFLAALNADPRWSDVSVIVISATIRRGAPNPVLRAQAFWSKPPDPEKMEAIHQYCPQHRESWPSAAAGS